MAKQVFGATQPKVRRSAAVIAFAVCASLSLGCASQDTNRQREAEATSSNTNMERQKTESKSGEVKSVERQVQTEVGKTITEKRSQIIKDAQTALEETRNALQALDRGDTKSALAALEQVTGKLDLVISRDAKLALAPVGVDTTIHDLYATPQAVKATVNQGKDLLSSNQIQPARWLLQDLASEADVSVIEIPLGTYPEAIKDVAPLIDAGKLAEAKAALSAALNTLVIETYLVPLPRIRAEAMIAEADKLAAKNNRSEDENNRLRNLIEGARSQIQLAEALGYGSSRDYKPLYAEVDEVEKETAGGKSGKGLFDKLTKSLENLISSKKRESHAS
jgi:hypothetical protein